MFQHRETLMVRAARSGARLLVVGGAVVALAGAGALPARAAVELGPAGPVVAHFQQSAGVGGSASGGATHGSVDTNAAIGAATGGSVLPGGASEPAPADCSLIGTADPATAAAIGAVLNGNPALTNAGNIGVTNPSAVDAGAAGSDPAGTLAALPDAATAGCNVDGVTPDTGKNGGKAKGDSSSSEQQ